MPVFMSGVVVRVVGMLRLDQANAPGQRDAAEQGRGEPEPVVGVERDLGQQVGQRDAQKDAGRERQASTQNRVGLPRRFDQPQGRQQGRDRTQRCKRQVRSPDGGTRPAARRHQRGDRQGIQRLVQSHCEERSQPPRIPVGAAPPFRHHRRPQRHAVDQRVQRQAQRQTRPTEAVRPAGGVVRGARGRRASSFLTAGRGALLTMHVPQGLGCVPCRTGRYRSFQQRHRPMLVGVHMEQPHQKEHRQEAPQHPPRHAVAVPQFRPGVRQQMQQGHPQHQPAHETHHALHPPVRERHPGRQAPAQHRGPEDADAIECQENKSFHRPILGRWPAAA